MRGNIDARLGQLKSRRKGIDRLERLSADERLEVLAKSLTTESYVTRTASKKYTQYAIGAMQAVDATYTRISLEEATRVGKQLNSGLTARGTLVDFRLQGSVPCDTHIRGVNDVDLLVLDTAFVTFDGPLLPRYSLVSYTPLSALVALRANAEGVLKDAFPKADVNTSGKKAIAISGGSLRRPVDVVPSHWHDTFAYQSSMREPERGVKILDKSVPVSILNMPFLHIERINQRDAIAYGGLKKAIRLCKNVKADAAAEGTTINLPSFDIAAIMWHANAANLGVGPTSELGILAEVARHLAYLVDNPLEAAVLDVPDGSRRILDVNGKFEGLMKLSAEIDDLALEVGREQVQLLREASPARLQIENVLRQAVVPA